MHEFKTAVRKNQRLVGFDYGQAGYYFITICAKNGLRIFGSVHLDKVVLSNIGAVAQSTWMEIPNWFPSVSLLEHVVMPNHFHGLLQTNEHNNPLKDIVGSFKSSVTRKSRQKGYLLTQELWQRGYYDHVVRSEKSLLNIRQYILNNPVNWYLDKLNPQCDQEKSTHGIFPDF